MPVSRNSITAQVMDRVGPDRVAKLARSMGVRDSALDPVPSLALGTSPVTLRAMVSAYGTIANQGAYLEPVMVTRIEDRNGEVLETFRHASPERALPVATAQTLLDVMRGVVDRGTGSSIRSRFGIRADVAGKTGTTQDNADGWFILMHPQLVAGAWVGFNDSRVTLRSDYWGQGAHSALPIVGDFYQRALRTRVIDGRARSEDIGSRDDLAPDVRAAIATSAATLVIWRRRRRDGVGHCVRRAAALFQRLDSARDARCTGSGLRVVRRHHSGGDSIRFAGWRFDRRPHRYSS